MAERETGRAGRAADAAADQAAADARQAPPKSAAEQRLEAELNAAEHKSAKDKAALERVRRKLTRLMLVSLTVTFIALAVVAAAIVYKISHTVSLAKKAALPPAASVSAAGAEQTPQAAANSADGAAPLSGLLIQTAPNSGAEQAFARSRQESSGAAAAEGQGQAALAAPPEQTLALQAGERLVSQSLYGTVLLLRVTSADGRRDRLILYDVRQGRAVARLNVEQAPQP